MDFRILGPLEASENDRVLPLGAPKERALLASLLLRAKGSCSNYAAVVRVVAPVMV